MNEQIPNRGQESPLQGLYGVLNIRSRASAEEITRFLKDAGDNYQVFLGIIKFVSHIFKDQVDKESEIIKDLLTEFQERYNKGQIIVSSVPAGYLFPKLASAALYESTDQEVYVGIDLDAELHIVPTLKSRDERDKAIPDVFAAIVQSHVIWKDQESKGRMILTRDQVIKKDLSSFNRFVMESA